MNKGLERLERAMPKNERVKILAKNNGWIRLSPFRALPDPTNLSDLKTEIEQRWSMTSLLDILKETDLRVNFTQHFTSVSSRESLEPKVLQKRLLTCLYGLGTNTGIKRLSLGEVGEKYQDLLYVRRKFIHKPQLRNAIAEIINATFLVRLPQIWGEGTTTCASDSKKFGAWDQNLMTEWHIRYGGRGVMIYWHVDQNSACIYSQLKTCSSSEVAAMIEGLLRHCTECQEEPVPEGVEIEDEEAGTETAYYELPGGIYYLPKATQFSRASRPYRFWRDDDGAIKTSPIVKLSLFRQQRTMYRENKVSAEIIKAHGGMFISDTYHPDTWIKGEIFPLYSKYDEQGNPASDATLINKNQQSYVPKVFIKCSKLLVISETESQGEERFTHIGIFYQLCGKWESVYTWHAPSYAGVFSKLYTRYHGGLERRIFRRGFWGNYVVEVPNKYLGDPLFLQIPNILAYHISFFDWRRGRGEGLWMPACDDRMYPDYRHFERVNDDALICSKRVPQENIMARCCSGIQCSEIIRRLKDTQKKLKELEKTIDKFEDVVAPDKFPVKFPRKLIDPTRPKGGGSVKLENYPRLFEYLMRQHDRTAGQWP